MALYWTYDGHPGPNTGRRATIMVHILSSWALYRGKGLASWVLYLTYDYHHVRFVKHGIAAIMGLMPGFERQSWALRIATLGDILVVGQVILGLGQPSRVSCRG